MELHLSDIESNFFLSIATKTGGYEWTTFPIHNWKDKIVYLRYFLFRNSQNVTVVIESLSVFWTCRPDKYQLS